MAKVTRAAGGPEDLNPILRDSPSLNGRIITESGFPRIHDNPNKAHHILDGKEGKYSGGHFSDTPYNRYRLSLITMDKPNRIGFVCNQKGNIYEKDGHKRRTLLT